MLIIADRPRGMLTLHKEVCFPISNSVRSLREGTRKKSEVVLSIPHSLPYDPKPFPPGLWRITDIEWQKDKSFDFDTYGTVKIRTNAWQWVEVWELDEDSDYLRPRGDEVKDMGYLLHWSASKTTLGCIRLSNTANAEILAKIIEKALERGEKVELEVI